MSFHAKYVHSPKEGAKILNLATRPLVNANAEELPVKRSIYIDKEMVPETVLYQAMHTVDNLTSRPEHYQKLHSHEFVETYLFLGSGPGYTGLTAEVVLGEDTRDIQSPASVYIPAGMKHKYRMVSGSGHLIVTALKSEYSYVGEKEDAKGEKKSP